MAKQPTCSRCGRPRPPTRPYCKPCHAMYLREWRKRHPMTPEQRLKANARALAAAYRRSGKLRPRPCRRCGEARTECHHPDYARPLFVIWLCRPCHLKLHAARRRREQ
jgi:hypothetical protein